MADSCEPLTLHNANLNALAGRQRGTYADRFTGDVNDMDLGFTGDVDDMDLEMNLENSQDDPADRGNVSLMSGRLHAVRVARAMKLASIISDQFDGTPASYAKNCELFDRIDWMLRHPLRHPSLWIPRRDWATLRFRSRRHERTL